MKNDATKDISSNEIKLTRYYDASLKTVWEAWSDPKQASCWWGPRGFTITTQHKDLKPGGSWVYTMHGPNGIDFPNYSKYLEVVNNSQLVYDHGGLENKPPMFRVVANFSESNGKTKLDMTMVFPTPEAAQATKKHIKMASGDSCWDRLAEYLEELKNKNVFVINRSFDASKEKVFEAWTDPRQYVEWLPTTGYTMKIFRADIHLGGGLFFFITDGEHVKMYARTHYKEIHKPHRIVYSQEFCDEKENVTRHPFAPVWPATLLVTVTLTVEDKDKTLVTVVSEPVGEVTKEEIECFKESRTGMTQGWSGSFDKLEELLKS